MNQGYSDATKYILQKVAERRAYMRADAFMDKCAEALMTKNASDWNTLRNALAYSELEKEAGIGKAIGTPLLALSMMFGGGRGAAAAQAGSAIVRNSAPVVQQAAQTVGKAVKSAPVKKLDAIPSVARASTAIKAAPAQTQQAARTVAKSAPAANRAAGSATSAAVPPPAGAGAAAGGKKSNLGKYLAALGIGAAGGGGTAYALTNKNSQPPAPPPAPGVGEQILALLGRGKQWVQDNPGTAAGIAGGALALGGLGYALGRS